MFFKLNPTLENSWFGSWIEKPETQSSTQTRFLVEPSLTRCWGGKTWLTQSCFQWLLHDLQTSWVNPRLLITFSKYLLFLKCQLNCSVREVEKFSISSRKLQIWQHIHLNKLQRPFSPYQQVRFLNINWNSRKLQITIFFKKKNL